MEEGESARHQPQEAAGGGRDACRHRRAPGYLVSDSDKGRLEKSYGSAASSSSSAPAPTACAERRLPPLVLLSDSSGILKSCNT